MLSRVPKKRKCHFRAKFCDCLLVFLLSPSIHYIPQRPPHSAHAAGTKFSGQTS